MAEDVLTDDELELEEERKRKPPPEAIGPPIAGSGEMGQPRGAVDTRSAAVPDQLSSPKSEAIGSPIQLTSPAAQRPNYEHYQQLLGEQQKPWHELGMGGKIGRVAESIGTAINPGVVAAIPGTQMHHQRDVSSARTAAEQENREIASQSEEQLRGAQSEEQRALAKKNAATPPDKLENPQQGYSKAIEDAIRRGVDPGIDPHVKAWADAITSIQKEPAQKPDTATQEDQKYEDIKKRQSMNQPVKPDEVAWAAAYEKRKTLAPALTSHAADERQNKTFTQQEKMFHMREQALSAATKTMIEAAPTVDGLASRIDPLIDKLSNELGPAAGRWSEFWAGKVGSANPEYTKLRTDVGLLQTALMRMHVGARGGHEMMAHFKDLIDQGKQDPDNMRAALSEIRQYVNDLKAKGAAGGMSPAVLGAGAHEPTAQTAPPKTAEEWLKSKQKKP